VARDLLHATARSGGTRGYYYQLLSSFGWTSLPLLPRLRPPALILAGDDDPIIPVVNARIMHRLIPRSQLHIYHGGHLELGASAERLAPVVEAFLSSGSTVNEYARRAPVGPGLPKSYEALAKAAGQWLRPASSRNRPAIIRARSCPFERQRQRNVVRYGGEHHVGDAAHGQRPESEHVYK